MFFILSETAAFFLLPSNFLIAFGFIGLVLMLTRFKRAGRRTVLASFVLLAVLGFSPLGAFLSHELESRFSPWDASRGAPDGIVVLGGGISSASSRDYGNAMISKDGGRVIALIKLVRIYPNARIVYSSGDSSLQGNSVAEADYLAPLLDSFGIRRDRVTREPRSRNTFENAAFTKDLVNPKPG